MKTFFDTNVLLDVLVKRIPHYTHSAYIWDFVKKDLIQGYISAITINNLYYILKRITGKDLAGKFIDEILDDFNIISLTGEILMQARTVKNKDYEDAIQYFSAVNAGCEFLITRNKKDFLSAGLNIVSPGELIKKIKF
jgi:predicted nucleic acid-binding protein